MSLVDVDGDPWLREHEACERLSRDIAAQLTERDSEAPKSAAYAKVSASVRMRLRQFSTEVQQLRAKLAVISNKGTLTPHEVERRTRLVELLESAEKQLQQRFNARDYDNDASRPQLMSGRASGSKVFSDMGTTGWGDDSELSSETFDVGQAQKLTQQVIKEQDAGLEELSKIISRQKNIARTIGEEVDTQNEILDDLADGIDRTTVGLINETHQVRTIARKDSTCGYWVLIILLFIAIVVVAVL